MQSCVHVIIFARERLLQVAFKSFEGVPRSMVKPWRVLGLAEVSQIMKNTTTAEEIHSSSSTGTVATTTEAAE
jgi:hypothetical protein